MATLHSEWIATYSQPPQRQQQRIPDEEEVPSPRSPPSLGCTRGGSSGALTSPSSSVRMGVHRCEGSCLTSLLLHYLHNRNEESGGDDGATAAGEESLSFLIDSTNSPQRGNPVSVTGLSTLALCLWRRLLIFGRKYGGRVGNYSVRDLPSLTFKSCLAHGKTAAQLIWISPHWFRHLGVRGNLPAICELLLPLVDAGLSEETGVAGNSREEVVGNRRLDAGANNSPEFNIQHNDSDDDDDWVVVGEDDVTTNSHRSFECPKPCFLQALPELRRRQAKLQQQNDECALVRQKAVNAESNDIIEIPEVHKMESKATSKKKKNQKFKPVEPTEKRTAGVVSPPEHEEQQQPEDDLGLLKPFAQAVTGLLYSNQLDALFILVHRAKALSPGWLCDQSDEEISLRFSPLHVAVFNQNWPLVKLLLRQSSEWRRDSTTGGRCTPEGGMSCSRSGLLDTPGQLGNRMHLTPLHLAVTGGRPHLLPSRDRIDGSPRHSIDPHGEEEPGVISGGGGEAKVGRTDERQWTALKIARLLLRRGANVEAQDDALLRPLQLAVRSDNLPMVNLILLTTPDVPSSSGCQGVNVNARGGGGAAALSGGMFVIPEDGNTVDGDGGGSPRGSECGEATITNWGRKKNLSTTAAQDALKSSGRNAADIYALLIENGASQFSSRQW